MIDCKTLGRKPGCIIWEIGAVMFDWDSKKKGSQFLVEVDVIDAEKQGLRIEAETMLFWQKQGGIRQGPARLDLEPALVSLARFIEANRPEEVWAWGMDFERDRVEAACDAVGLRLPWHYGAGNDARTVAKLAGVKRSGVVSHNALEDCEQQVKAMNRARKVLRGGGGE